jgi:hypothetical protein
VPQTGSSKRQGRIETPTADIADRIVLSVSPPNSTMMVADGGVPARLYVRDSEFH